MQLENLREVIHTEVNYEERPGVGHSVAFTDEIYDADDNLIGTCSGLSVVFSDPSDGHLRQLVSATDTFPDGTVHWSGAYDMHPGDAEHAVPAFGTGGRYLGMAGRRAWRMTDRPDEKTTICVTSLRLEPVAPEVAAAAQA